MRSSFKKIVLWLAGLVVLAGAAVFLHRVFFPYRYLHDSKAPYVYKANPIPASAEPFRKEVLLYNLNHAEQQQFIPGPGFDLRSHYDGVLKNNYQDNYARKNVASQVFDYPWGMDFLPDDSLLITTRFGHLLHYLPSHPPQQKQVQPISGIPRDLATDGYQAGLMDIAVDTDFANSHAIFFSFVSGRHNAKGQREYTPCVVRALLEGNSLTVDKRFCVQVWSLSNTQFGGGLALDEEGHLFFAVGDRSQRDAAQNLKMGFGKILRLDKNTFKVPADNPFLDDKGKPNAVWSYGHRNPQGLFYDREQQVLYEVEHGPRGGDELNIILRGANYGWPDVGYGKEYEVDKPVGSAEIKPGIAQPLYYFVPSISPSTVIRYRGSLLPELRGSFLLGSLGGMHLNELVKRDIITKEKRYLSYWQLRYRDIKQAPDGSLYLLAEAGYLIRLYR